MFDSASPGDLITINGLDPVRGPWTHRAFMPQPLGDQEPTLRAATYRQVSRTRAALATLDSTARQLPNPALLRRPTLNREAQSTSALEGTYAPLRDVLIEDENEPSSVTVREVLNYVVMAEHAFSSVRRGRPLTVGMLAELQAILVDRTPSESPSSGRIRDIQVVIGRRPDASPDMLPVHASRFVPSPPGLDLQARVRDLLEWVSQGRRDDVDPVVAAAMAHYQFESLHPFHDGNGRLGRLLVVLQFLVNGVLTEPTLTVSPWFESRRSEYYDRLYGVSTQGAWDEWVHFFAQGIEQSALDTHHQLRSLLRVQGDLKEVVRASPLRADNALKLVDVALARPSFTARQVEADLGVSYARANGLISQLVELAILEPVRKAASYDRRFRAPRIHAVILGQDLPEGAAR